MTGCAARCGPSNVRALLAHEVFALRRPGSPLLRRRRQSAGAHINPELFAVGDLRTLASYTARRCNPAWSCQHRSKTAPAPT